MRERSRHGAGLRRRPARRLVAHSAIALAIALCALALAVAVASAHANVERAQPAADSALPQPPDRVTIRFTEPVAPALSAIEVLDAAGDRVDADDSAVDAADPHVMSVSLPVLSNGTYTVFWRNVSTVDGHARRGTYVFYVGERPANAPASSVETPPLFTSQADPVARWLVLIGGLVAVGGLAFQLTVARPALAQAAGGAGGARAAGASTTAATAAELERRLRVLVAGALALLLVASLAHAVIQAINARDVSLVGALGEPIRSVIGGTRWGHFWLARLVLTGLAVPVLVAWWRTPLAGPAASWRARAIALPLAAFALLVGALITLSFASHGAVTRGVEGGAVMSDALHLLAAATWAGGLPAMAIAVVLVRRIGDDTLRRGHLRALASRFSALGVLGTGTLLITGLYSAWAQLVAWRALDTPYGRLVLIKVALLLVLIALGAVNQRRLAPRLARGLAAQRWLGRIVRVEVALAALAVLAAAMLTAIEPGRQTAAREVAAEGVRFTQEVESTRIGVTIQPGAIGANDVTVDLTDARGRPVDDAMHVGLRVQFVGADLGATELTATHSDGGRYLARDAQLSVAGRWQLEIDVSRPDALDARTAFRFDVGIGSGAAAADFEPSATTGNLAWAWEVMLLGGLVLVVTNTWWSRDRIARGVNVLGTGVVVIGIVMWFGIGHTHIGAPPVTSGPVNPITPDAASIAAGAEIFQAQCTVCHGSQGVGDGPDAAGLNPPPANLSTHVPLHSDGEIFAMVADGFPRTAMVGFRDRLTDEQIWNIVNFLRTLEDPNAAGGAVLPVPVTPTTGAR